MNQTDILHEVRCKLGAEVIRLEIGEYQGDSTPDGLVGLDRVCVIKDGNFSTAFVTPGEWSHPKMLIDALVHIFNVQLSSRKVEL